MDDWDPIGVRGDPEAADEYDSYIMPLYTILRRSHSEDALLDYLTQMTERMGLPAPRHTLHPIAMKLLQIDLDHDEPQPWD